MIDGYVYKQTAINAICKDWCNRDYCGDCFFHGAKQAIDVLKALPDADVQPVIRCKDCKWSDWYTAVDGKQYCCCMETGASARTETDYCSFAERDGEQND